MSDVPWGNETERADYWLSEWKTEHAENKQLTAKLNALEVDAVPVVRCGECIKPLTECPFKEYMILKADYCSRGEKMEVEQG